MQNEKGQGEVLTEGVEEKTEWKGRI
jgi:hypothetical protein